MNPAPTNATTHIADGEFAKGAAMGVNNGTDASGNRPATIVSRRDYQNFRGSDQPIYKGAKRKFFDAAENHPMIPKSGQTDFTRETEAVPAQSGEPNSKIRTADNANI